MEPCIILKMNNLSAVNGDYIHLSNLVETTETDMDFAMVFKDFDTAKKYQDKHGVNGRVVKIPLY